MGIYLYRNYYYKWGDNVEFIMLIKPYTHPIEIFKKLADREAELNCEVFLPQYEMAEEQIDEDYRLNFTETPPLPKYQAPKKQEEKNVLLLALSILRP